MSQEARFLNTDGLVHFLPANRAIITAEDIAADSGADVEVVRAVMESYAQTFDDSVPPARRVYDLLTASNPFQITPLVSDGAGNYVVTANGVGLDSLRRIVESALAGTPQFHRYDKRVRQVVSERLATTSLEKVLRTPPRLAGFTYYAHRNGPIYAVSGLTVQRLGLDESPGVALRLKSSDYFAFLATQQLDRELPDGSTVRRKYLDPYPPGKAPEFMNTSFGTYTAVITADNFAIFSKRSNTVGVSKASGAHQPTRRYPAHSTLTAAHHRASTTLPDAGWLKS